MTKYIKKEIYPAGQNLYYKTWGNHQTALFAVFVFFIILLSIVYLYFTADMVMKAVERGAQEKKLGIARQEYQELEKQYLISISKFSLDNAGLLGFVSTDSSTYINRISRLSQNY